MKKMSLVNEVVAKLMYVVLHAWSELNVTKIHSIKPSQRAQTGIGDSASVSPTHREDWHKW